MFAAPGLATLGSFRGDVSKEAYHARLGVAGLVVFIGAIVLVLVFAWWKLF